MHSKTQSSLVPPLENLSPLLLLLAFISVYKLTYLSWDEFPKPIGILIQYFHTQTFSPIIFRQLVLCPYYFKQLHLKNQMCWRHLLISLLCLFRLNLEINLSTCSTTYLKGYETLQKWGSGLQKKVSRSDRWRLQVPLVPAYFFCFLVQITWISLGISAMSELFSYPDSTMMDWIAWNHEPIISLSSLTLLLPFTEGQK